MPKYYQIGMGNDVESPLADWIISYIESLNSHKDDLKSICSEAAYKEQCSTFKIQAPRRSGKTTALLKLVVHFHERVTVLVETREDARVLCKQLNEYKCYIPTIHYGINDLEQFESDKLKGIVILHDIRGIPEFLPLEDADYVIALYT